MLNKNPGNTIDEFDNQVTVLKTFVSRDEVGMNEVDEVSKRYLVKDNILFVDPLRMIMKPQSKLNLQAIRTRSDERNRGVK